MYRRERIDDVQDILGKLTRIETRMLRGFDALGVNVKASPGWLEVDEDKQTILLNSDHYTLFAIQAELDHLRIVTNGQYRVEFQGRTLCYM